MSELNATTLVFGFIWYIAFLFSTTCHEASHALVAKLGGDDTADRAGQVTLNPVPHIRREPWGMVVIPLVSFLFFGWMIGWASAPYNPEWQARHPRRGGLMASDGYRRNLDSSRAWLGLAGFVARWPAGHAGYNPDCVLSIEPAAGDIQPFSSASAGWQHRSDGVHGRLDGEAVYELAANHALSELGIAGGAAGVPLLLCAGGEVRDKFAAIHEILINDLLRQFDTVQKNCFAA